MKQKRTFVTLLLIVALLCLGIGYAAIAGVTLTINGKAYAEAEVGNIDVRFEKAETKSKPEDATVTAEPSTDGDFKIGTFNVSGLKKEGDSVTVDYTIKNYATDIDATLTTPDVEWTNKTWYGVECTLSDEGLERDTTETATVVVTLLKTPVSEADEAAAKDETITITIDADPVDNSTSAQTNN